MYVAIFSQGCSKRQRCWSIFFMFLCACASVCRNIFCLFLKDVELINISWLHFLFWKNFLSFLVIVVVFRFLLLPREGCASCWRVVENMQRKSISLLTRKCLHFTAIKKERNQEINSCNVSLSLQSENFIGNSVTQKGRCWFYTIRKYLVIKGGGTWINLLL